MIELKRKILPNDIDHLYKDLAFQINSGNKILDLKIPNVIDAKYFNTIPLLIQFISTWAHHPRAGNLLTDILTSTSDETFEDWCKSNIHFICLLLCWNRKVLSKEGADVKLRFKKSIDERLESMKHLQAISGNEAVFTCVDDYNDEIGLLRHFYGSDRELLNKGDITKSYFTSNLLKNIIKFHVTAAPGIKKIAEECQSIIYELFENTHYWARTTFDNSKSIYPSVRGVQIKFHRYKEEALKKGITENKLFNIYFQHNDFRPNPQGELYFLEFTIFDCGDGFVKRYTGEESSFFSQAEKVSVVKKCLWKGFSSQKGYTKYERGNGLFLLCTILNNKGFLRIRTDDLDLFRDFKTVSFEGELKKMEVDPEQNFDAVRLFDWATGNDKDYTKLELQNKGTTISVVYPLEYNQFVKEFINADQTSLFNE